MKNILKTKREQLLGALLVGVVLAVLAWITGTALGHLSV